MKCSECNKRPATVHYTQIINGKKTDFHVCDVCATNKGYITHTEETYSLHDLLTGLFNFGSSKIDLQNDNLFTEIEELQCNKCHLTFNDFQRIGKFGCAHCYTTFKQRLDSIFRRVHSGNTKHFGKIPKRQGKHIYVKKEIEQYRKQLQQLIAEEKFEQAAIVRDEIKKLEAMEEGDHS